MQLVPALSRSPGYALRQALRDGYSLSSLRADVLAGLVVGIVALPLSMALAIASGVAPQHGLYTAIVAGAVIAALGGSRVQVSGPTAAFVVILAPISAEFGLGGLCLATAMAGVVLLAMGVARLGRMVTFIPYPVTAGFTAGIGMVIATLQIKDFLGLSMGPMPSEYYEKVHALFAALPTWRWQDASIGVLTLALLLIWPKVTRKVPAPLAAVLIATVVAWLLSRFVPGFSVATIASRFSYVVDGLTKPGIPALPPLPGLPWNLPGPDGQPLHISLNLLRELAPAALAIAMLGAIESLLSAVVADGMTGFQHDPDAELIGQGVGNVLSPFFGGIAATGAIARTATNVRAGGRSPIASIVHALFVLAAVAALAPLLGFLPMASLAALLLLVAWTMSEARHVLKVIRIAPRSDVTVLLTCFGLTVMFDMVVAVGAGVLLAALLFIRRMAEVSGVRMIAEEHRHLDVPEGLLLYDIAGPLFFGAAQKAMSTIRAAGDGVKVALLDMRDVPAMDATGLVNLDSAIAELRKRQIQVIIAGVQPQPLRVLERGEIVDEPGHLAVRVSFEEGMALARELLKS